MTLVAADIDLSAACSGCSVQVFGANDCLAQIGALPDCWRVLLQVEVFVGGIDEPGICKGGMLVLACGFHEVLE